MKKHSFPGMFFRSFLLQSVWNFERMQNVGFLFTVLPSLKKIYPDKKERLIAIK
ncbi:MAG: PTS system mannose/fructose/sorbose family transporter subunit IID, partial [Elusimicrobiota bacterium]